MSFLINLIKEDSPPHKHKNYEIIVYTKGTGTIRAAGKDIAVAPGKIIIIPPGVVHQTSKSSASLERIYINGEFNQVLFLASPTIVSNNCANEGLSLAKMIYTNRYSNNKYVVALINALTHFLLQNIEIEGDIFLAIKNIVEEISKNFYDCNIELNALLKKSGYSEDYIRAQFKQITGKTPTEFLTEIRIKHACCLIDIYKNSFSLADIAEKCGYSDYVYFSRRFKQIMGLSPKAYMTDN